jgi:hypothetical protein
MVAREVLGTAWRPFSHASTKPVFALDENLTCRT